MIDLATPQGIAQFGVVCSVCTAVLLKGGDWLGGWLRAQGALRDQLVAVEVGVEEEVVRQRGETDRSIMQTLAAYQREVREELRRQFEGDLLGLRTEVAGLRVRAERSEEISRELEAAGHARERTVQQLAMRIVQLEAALVERGGSVPPPLWQPGDPDRRQPPVTDLLEGENP